MNKKCKVCSIVFPPSEFYGRRTCKRCFWKAQAIYVRKKDFGLLTKYWSMVYRGRYTYTCSYKNYAGRGIKVIWKSYKEFRADMYQSYVEHLEKYGRKETTLDRIDVNGNYCKENCRWATNEEQNNNKTTSKYLTLDGETLTVTQWERRYGYLKQTIRNRLRSGWSVERAIKTTLRKNFRHKSALSKV